MAETPEPVLSDETLDFIFDHIKSAPAEQHQLWSSLDTKMVSIFGVGSAIWARRHDDLAGLVHHSDRGVQYLAIPYTDRLTEAGALASVGSKGDSYDNALAETVNGLYKAELIWRRGPWRTASEVELATLAWVDWWNHRRLHAACGHLPPVEFERGPVAEPAA